MKEIGVKLIEVLDLDAVPHTLTHNLVRGCRPLKFDPAFSRW